MMNWIKNKMKLRNFFKKDELRLLWPFYFTIFFLSIFFIYPVFEILYYLGIGLSLTQIGIIVGAVSLATFLFEIPTGVVADVFGRKISCLIGILIEGIALILVYFNTNFYILVVLFFIVGLAETFISGAEEAWIIDWLKYNKRKDLVEEYFAKSYSFNCAAMVLAGIVGAFFVDKFGLSSIFLVTGASMFAVLIIYLIPKENFRKRKNSFFEDLKETKNHTKKSFKFIRKDKLILLLFVLGIIVTFGYNFGANITWYPFLQSLGLQEANFGYVYSAMWIIGIFSPFIAKKIRQRIGKFSPLLRGILIVIILISISVLFVKTLLFGILFYVLFMSAFDFYGPTRETFFHKLIPSKMRATITSGYSMFRSIVVIIAPPLVGFVAEKIGPQNTIAICSLILIPAVFLYTKIKK
jgi:DHA3 family tetracycline resistance protein-like MFS transporter